MTRWMTFAREFVSGIWFRAALFTVAAIAVTVLAYLVGTLAPNAIPVDIGQGAVGPILEILAASMLAVTTFSLTAMVAAYSSAASSGTPRSTQLLVADPTSKNALSTFVGTFAFAIVGIVAISADVYTEAGETLLFLATLAVIILILFTLLRWIAFLTTFGRMDDIIDRVERAAAESMQAYARDPWLGAREWTDPPAGATSIPADVTGFVLRVDVHALQHIAVECQGQIWVSARGGSRASPHTALAVMTGNPNDEVIQRVQHAFVVEQHRTYEHDPRLGLIALSEISSRALSPGINDPGTAIEILGALQRVLSVAMNAASEPNGTCDRVHLDVLSPRELTIDAFRPTSRDGAGIVEVAIRIQKEIGTLLADARGAWPEALTAASTDAYERARDALTHDADLDAVAQARPH